MSCVRLLSAEYDLFQVELSKNYGLADWHDDLKKVMLKAGIDNKPVVFLFSDTQVGSISARSRISAKEFCVNASSHRRVRQDCPAVSRPLWRCELLLLFLFFNPIYACQSLV